MIFSQVSRKSQRHRLRVAVFGLVGYSCLVLSACQQANDAPRNYKLLATDVHVSVADHQLILPFIALPDYGAQQSFSLNREQDATNRAYAIAELMHDASNPAKPKSFDRLSVKIGTYGWNDGDMQQRKICSMLTREWARSVCDNPWAVVQQSLPNWFELVDLSRVRFVSPEPRVPRCARNGAPLRPFPTRPGEAVLLCEQEIYGRHSYQSFVAVVRIHGNLGVAWSVSDGGESGENAEARAAREGKAIIEFVRLGIGVDEDFPKFYKSACELRAPKSMPGLHHLDCGDAPRR
jgi:hypothetical protein